MDDNIILSQIGNTPLIKLKQASELTNCNIYGKAEYANPGKSVKDRAALFIVKDAKLLTPKTDFCLNGITRQSVIEIAQNLGIEVQEKDLLFDDLVNADEAFFSGTAVEITPITKVDGLKIRSGMIGPISESLQTKYSEIVCGKDANYSEWLTNI